MVKSILKITDIQRILQQSDEQVERPSEKRQGIHLKPSIWAMPGAVISQGTSVTILCRGPPGITRYRLEQAGSSQVWYEENPQDFQKEATSSSHWSQAAMQDLILVNMRNTNSDLRKCTERLLLCLHAFLSLGVYQEPKISIQQDSMLKSLKNKCLKCFSMNWFDEFLLSKEGNADTPQGLRSQYKAGMFQASFPLSSVSLFHEGTYRCYGSLNTFLLSVVEPQ
nr:leukocyte immunoglobulin-like receptor subfamily A member 6 [Loxodonta africana]